MVVRMFGGPKFLCKILPVKETAKVFFDQTNTVLKNFKNAGPKVVGIICGITSSFFKKIDTISQWCTKNS